MRELNVNEIKDVNGGMILAFMAGIGMGAAMLVGCYQVGQMIGEVAQRNYEASQK